MDYAIFRPQLDEIHSLLMDGKQQESVYQKTLELLSLAYQEGIRQGRDSANY